MLQADAAAVVGPDSMFFIGHSHVVALVVSAVARSAHDMLGLAQHLQPFDFVLPEEQRVVFAPTPEAAMADGRFLRPEFDEGRCQAKAAYGALVLRDIGAA